MSKKSKVSIDDFSYHEEEERQPLNIIAKNIQRAGAEKDQQSISELTQTNHKPLVSRESGVSSALDKPLVSRESGVSSALDKKIGKSIGVSSALAIPLDESPVRRESGVSSALDISGLVGKEKSLIIFIAEECRRLGDLETDFIGSEDLKILLHLDSLGLRNLIFRVKEKGFIEVTAKQFGRVGLRKFKISRSIYQQGIDSALVSRESGVRLGVSSALAIPLETPPCSSSNLSINNTTTTPGELEPDLWLSVPKNLEGRISLKQLRDFVKQGLITPEDLQSSLDGFSYDLAKNAIKSKLGNPVAILIGAVKSGGYISQSYLSELKASMADVERSRLEMQQIQSSLALEQIQKEFESFRSEFPAEAEKFKPTSTYLTNFEPGSVGYKIWLEEYKKHQNTQHNEAANELAL